MHLFRKRIVFYLRFLSDLFRFRFLYLLRLNINLKFENLKLLKKILSKIRSFFNKRRFSSEKIILDAIAELKKSVDNNALYEQIGQEANSEEVERVIKQIAQHETAKEIVDVDLTIQSVLSRNGSKLYYDLAELKRELLNLTQRKALLDFTKSKIKKIQEIDFSLYEEAIDRLRELLSKNKLSNNLDFKGVRISTFEQDYSEFEKLVSNNSTLKRFELRERIAKENIRKAIQTINELILSKNFTDAKHLIEKTSRAISNNKKRKKERNALNEALNKCNFAKARQELVIKQNHEQARKRQAEEATRIRIQHEKIAEEERQKRESLESERKAEEANRYDKERRLNELLEFKFNWRDFEKVLRDKGIEGFYHFTDERNMSSIIENKGLFSWYYCDINNIDIPASGGSLGSRENDRVNGKKDFVRLAFNKTHPMLFNAKKDGRIFKEKWLNIDIKVAFLKNTEFSDKNAAAFTSYTPIIGKELINLENIRFDLLRKRYFDLNEEDKKYYQAEVLVKTWVPLEYVTNLNELVK